jgi:hypothetical protein
VVHVLTSLAKGVLEVWPTHAAWIEHLRAQTRSSPTGPRSWVRRGQAVGEPVVAYKRGLPVGALVQPTIDDELAWFYLSPAHQSE